MRAPERGERNQSVNFFRPFQGLLIYLLLIPTAHAVGYYLSPLAGLKNADSEMITSIHGFRHPAAL